MKLQNPFFIFTFFALIATAYFSCNKDTPKAKLPISGRDMKFTISAEGIKSYDTFSLSISGVTVGGKDTSIFKKNGVLQNGVKTVSVQTKDLLSGSVIIEGNELLFETVMGFTGYTSGETHSYVLKITPIINGEIDTNYEPITITRTLFQKTFNFN